MRDPGRQIANEGKSHTHIDHQTRTHAHTRQTARGKKF